jgi:hypothetical protein
MLLHQVHRLIGNIANPVMPAARLLGSWNEMLWLR